MNLQIITGRMYNGAVHGYTHQKEERSCFRGRLNFRLPNGDYAWIDGVCFKDNPSTDANGLVGWLEENYLAPEDEADGHGGRAIEVTGWLKPSEKFKTHAVKIKGGGTKDIPDIPYDTFEIVIESASFVPTSQGDESNSSRRGRSQLDEDFDLDDEDLDIDMDDEDEAPPARGNNGGNRGRNSSSSTGRSGNNRNRTGNSSGSRSDRRSSGSSSSSSTGRSGNSSTGRSGGSSSSSKNKDRNRTGSGKSGSGNGSNKSSKEDKQFFED